MGHHHPALEAELRERYRNARTKEEKRESFLDLLDLGGRTRSFLSTCLQILCAVMVTYFVLRAF